MKVLHISTMDYGGAGLCCLRIHHSLLSSGIESKMVVLKNTQHAEEEYQYGYLRDIISKIPSRILRLFGVKFSDENVLRALAKDNQTAYTLPFSSVDISKCEWINWADIIHLHWVNNYLDYSTFFCKIRKPIVWTLHDENLFYGIAHHRKSILNHPLEEKCKKIKSEALKSASKLTIVFLSQLMLQKFGNERIIEGRDKFVINNSVDTQIFKPCNRISLRYKYGLNQKVILFSFIAINIADPNKGLDMLSKVLFEIDPQIQILAIGGNPLKKQWINVRSVGLIDNQDEMCELISCTNYMAMPSFQEAFAQSPMEAMACGLPVVVFPVSGTSELVNDENGVVCDGFTERDLRKGIETLLSRCYDADIIRNDVINRFSPGKIALEYINLYEFLMRKEETL